MATPDNIAGWNSNTCRAAMAWQNDQPVGVAWIAAESFAEEDLGLRFQLSDDEVWLYAAVVAPAARRQGIYRQLLEFLISELSQTEVRRILLGVSLGNRPSQIAHVRLGAKQLGSVFVANCLGLTGCKVHGQVRRISKRSLAWRQPIEVAVDRG